MATYIRKFHDIRKEDVALAGGKGANLGEMVSAKIPIPHGAVLIADAYVRFLEEIHIDIPELII